MLEIADHSFEDHDGPAPAFYGLGIVENGKRMTRKGWMRYAKRFAKQAHKRDGIPWEPVVSWVPWRNAYRINLAHQRTPTANA